MPAEPKNGLRIGTAPDSWGVWFPDDPRQTPWNRFLDEVQEAGYSWIELGPYGYLPTDPHQLEDELGKRELSLSAGTMFTAFHKQDSSTWEDAWEQAEKIGSLVSRLGAEHLVVIPALWGPEELSTPKLRALDEEQWTRMTEGHNRLGKALLEEFGLKQQFHSHAESHIGTYREVERFVNETDPQYANLCLDTGHFAYYGGDNLKLINAYPDRIGYLHLKQVDPDFLFDVLKNGISFVDAVPQGIMTEPPRGIPDFAPIIEAVSGIDPNIFAIVEQDMYPVRSFDDPMPIATRTLKHIFGCTSHARVR
jgi:inosose dehydratase